MLVESIRAHLMSLGVDASEWTHQQIMDHTDGVMLEYAQHPQFGEVVAEFLDGVKVNMSAVANVLTEDLHT